MATPIVLSLQSVTVLSPAALRVRFTTPPFQANPQNANDALNPKNYSFSGPSAAPLIAQINNVSADVQCIDLLFSAPFLLGTWTLTVSNITAPDGTPLSTPFSQSFTLVNTSGITPIASGASNDSPADIVRKHFSQAMGGFNWNGVIAALGAGDKINRDNAQAAFDQIFKISASGKYLDRLSSNDGIQRPQNVGMSDTLFRSLSITLATNKVVHDGLREILKVYYGRDALQAYAETTSVEPFALSAGLVLQWTLDEDATQTFTQVFSAANFRNISQASALEVAAVLTKTMRDGDSEGFAAAYTDPLTGLNKVRIYSASLGLKSFVRVTGGNAQPFLNFPTLRTVYSGTVTSANGYNWVYTNLTPNTTQLSLTTTGQPLISVTPIMPGDYVVVGTDAQSVPGIYPISNVTYSWSGGNLTQNITLNVNIGFTGSALQLSNLAYSFYSPTKCTTLNGSRTVVVAQTTNNEVEIQIPATTQAVNRTARTAAYARLNSSLSISFYERDGSGNTTISTAVPHNLSVGNQIYIDGLYPSYGRPWISPGTPGTYPAVATTDASYGTNFSGTQQPPTQTAELFKGTLLGNGNYLITGGVYYTTNTYSGELATCNTLQFNGTTPVTDGSLANGALRQQYQFLNPPNMSAAKVHHGLSTLLDGRALSSGGMNSLATTPVFLNTAEIYSSSTNNWTSASTLALARAGHQQITLNDGRVMVIGGAWNNGTATNTVEFYNPTTASWSSGPSMTYARYGHKAVKLNDGRVMVIGGMSLGQGAYNDSSTLAYWNFDESSGWTAADGSANAYTLNMIGQYVNCPGTGGYVSTPDSAALTITGDLDIRVFVGLTTWGRAARDALVSHWYGDWAFTTLSTAFRLDVNGGAAGYQVNIPATFVNGVPRGVRVTLKLNNGSGNSVATFYESPDGLVWTQIGSPQTGTVIGSITHTSLPLRIGSLDGTSYPAQGNFYSAQVCNGINGPVVANFNANDGTIGNTTFNSSATGETYTINGTASLTGVSVPPSTGKIALTRDFSNGGYGIAAGNSTASTSLTGDWTVEFWLPNGATSASGNLALMTYGGPSETTADNILMQIGVNTSNYIWWRWEYGSGSEVNNAQTTGAFVNVLNTHVAIRKHLVSGNANVDLFINGVLTQSWTSITNSAGGTSGNWYINKDSEATLTSGNKKIDDVRISTVARTNAEIAQTYINGMGRATGIGAPYFYGGQTHKSTEIFNPTTNSWATGPSMKYTRSFFGASVMADGRVVVTGGLGRDPKDALPALTSTFASTYWPNTSLNTTEAWHATENRWVPGPFLSARKFNHMNVYLPNTDRIWIGGGTSIVPNYSLGTVTNDDTTAIELYNSVTGRISQGFNSLASSGRVTAGMVGNDMLVLSGGRTAAGTTLANYDLWIPGSDKVDGGGLNGIQVVSSIINSTTFQVQTPNCPSYTSNFGPLGGGLIALDTANTYGSVPQYQSYNNTDFIVITSGTRASNVTTLTVSGLGNIAVGSSVFININNNVNFSNGIKTVTALTATTLSYAETAANIGATTINGTVAINYNSTAILTPFTAVARPTSDPGPYIFDPKNGLSIQPSLTSATVSGAFVNNSVVPILKGNKYSILVVTSTTGIPASGGYLVLGYGTAKQSAIIKYIEVIDSQKILIDFGYTFQYGYSGSDNASVNILQGRAPFVPAQPSQSANFYLTGSSAGLSAAESTVQSAAAAGINVDVTVVYPGDRGLGGEGYPTEGTGKLSDIVKVFGSDTLE